MPEGRQRRAPHDGTSGSFADVVLPHLADARRLASWLLRNEHDAEDAVQEASLRALRYFATFGGGNARAWFLCIVRHTCTGGRGPRILPSAHPFDADGYAAERTECDPEARLRQRVAADAVARIMGGVPPRFRELLVLRELEGLSYREIADRVGIPVGTVMSGLSRGRQALRRAAAASEAGHRLGGSDRGACRFRRARGRPALRATGRRPAATSR